MPDITSNLQLWWKLDGDATDGSPNGYTGTTSGGVTWVTGQIGQAAHFAGSDAIQRNSTATFGNPLTISCWFNLDNTNLSGLVGYTSSGTDDGVQLAYNSGYSVCRINGVNSDGGNTVFTSTGVWYFFAVVVSDQIYFYTAAAGGSIVSSAQTIQTITGTATQMVCGFTNYGPNFLTGSMDDVRIYSRALASTDIDALFAYTGGAATPVPFWRLTDIYKSP